MSGGKVRRICSQSGGRSAVVTYPAASTNRRNRAFVTSASSTHSPPTRTRWAGRSAAGPASEPMTNSPPATHTMPGGAAGPTSRVNEYSAANAMTAHPTTAMALDRLRGPGGWGAGL